MIIFFQGKRRLKNSKKLQNSRSKSINIMSSKLKKAIGAVKDRTSISLAKVSSYNTSNLDVAVLKATTHNNVPMEDRHVHEILRLVSSNKVYAAACARAIGKRISRTRNWIVALKSLLLVLRIFQDGDPYFPREVLHAMKRGAKILNLSSFRDDSNSSPWDFTAFVRTFALYLDERLDCFLTGKLQRRFTYCQNRRVSDDCSRSRRGGNEAVRDMKPTMLLDKVANWQRLLERAIATRPTGAAKMNRFVQLSLYAIVQESFELYKDISDGLSLLLDNFYNLHYQNCLIAYQICVKARKQHEELTAFYTSCKSLGIGRTSEYPSVRTIQLEVIETLQEFLKDQSSFSPAPPPNNIVKSQNPLLLLPAPAPAGYRAGAGPNTRGPHPLPAPRSATRPESYGAQSDFSFTTTTTTDGYSERASENASSHCTSLEDLISATEISNLTAPSISIDLEAYPEKFEEHTRGGPSNTFNRLSDSGSTQSLPISSSIDLLALDECPLESESELETKGNRQPPPPAAGLHREAEEDKLESSSSSAQGWELVLLAENNAITTTEEQTPNVTANIGTPEPDDPSRIFGWELELETPTMPPPTLPPPPPSSSSSQSMMGNTTTTTTNHASSIDNLFDSELSIPSSSHHYNPFLQDTIELPTTCSSSSNPTPINFPSESQAVLLPPDSIASVPTFQASFPSPTFRATPTFSSQSSNVSENDPFGLVYNDRQLYSSSMNQQNLLHEQQLWFANQNKIIAKRMA